MLSHAYFHMKPSCPNELKKIKLPDNRFCYQVMSVLDLTWSAYHDDRLSYIARFLESYDEIRIAVTPQSNMDVIQNIPFCVKEVHLFGDVSDAIIKALPAHIDTVHVHHGVRNAAIKSLGANVTLLKIDNASSLSLGDYREIIAGRVDTLFIQWCFRWRNIFEFQNEIKKFHGTRLEENHLGIVLSDSQIYEMNGRKYSMFEYIEKYIRARNFDISYQRIPESRMHAILNEHRRQSGIEYARSMQSHDDPSLVAAELEWLGILNSLDIRESDDSAPPTKRLRIGESRASTGVIEGSMPANDNPLQRNYGATSAPQSSVKRQSVESSDSRPDKLLRLHGDTNVACGRRRQLFPGSEDDVCISGGASASQSSLFNAASSLAASPPGREREELPLSDSPDSKRQRLG